MRIPRYFALLTVILLVGIAGSSRAQKSYEDCFQVIGVQHGEQCTNSIRVEWKNICNESMDIKIALQKEDGGWSTGVAFDVEPGDTAGYWTCRGTGIYRWWGRPVNSSIKFPSDKSINEKYK